MHAPSFGSAPSGQQEATVPPMARHVRDACNERSAASTDAPPATMMGATRESMIEEDNLRNMIDDICGEDVVVQCENYENASCFEVI